MPSMPPSLWAEIQLGNPRAECARYGICVVDRLPARAARAYVPVRLRRVLARLSRSADGGLHLCFPARGMLASTRALFFASGEFRVEAPLALPAPIGQALGLPGFVIEPGVYAVQAGADGLDVELGCTDADASRKAVDLAQANS